MEIFVIIRKNYPKYVRKFTVSELDLTKCSAKFIKHVESHLKPDSPVFVKCNSVGEIDYRLKSNDKQEYRIYDLTKHEIQTHGVIPNPKYLD